MAEELSYYKVNVGYSVGVRLFIGDKDGSILSPGGQDTIAVPIDRLRDFKNANKKSIINGMIIPVDEPNLQWETTNALTDEDISDLLKVFTKLKSTIPTIDSLPILYKMLDMAKFRELSKKTLSLIQSRIDELEPEDGPIFRPEDMQGVV
jgi:hypothetical protein